MTDNDKIAEGIVFFVIGLSYIAFWGAIVFAAIHFVVKFW